MCGGGGGGGGGVRWVGGVLGGVWGGGGGWGCVGLGGRVGMGMCALTCLLLELVLGCMFGAVLGCLQVYASIARFGVSCVCVWVRVELFDGRCVKV